MNWNQYLQWYKTFNLKQRVLLIFFYHTMNSYEFFAQTEQIQGPFESAVTCLVSLRGSASAYVQPDQLHGMAGEVSFVPGLQKLGKSWKDLTREKSFKCCFCNDIIKWNMAACTMCWIEHQPLSWTVRYGAKTWLSPCVLGSDPWILTKTAASSAS